MYLETTVSTNSGTGLQGNHICLSAGDGGMLGAGRAVSGHPEDQRDTRR